MRVGKEKYPVEKLRVVMRRWRRVVQTGNFPASLAGRDDISHMFEPPCGWLISGVTS
jgi:hypothetical protein